MDVYRSATRVATAHQFDGSEADVVTVGDWVKSNGVHWGVIAPGAYYLRDGDGVPRVVLPGYWVVKRDQQQAFDVYSPQEFEEWEPVPTVRPATLLDERRRLIRD